MICSRCNSTCKLPESGTPLGPDRSPERRLPRKFGKLYGSIKLTSTGEGRMPRREEHCYRCGYVWAPRRRRVRICSRCKSPYFWLPKLRVPRYGGGLGIGEVIGPKRDEVLKVALRCGATNV